MNAPHSDPVLLPVRSSRGWWRMAAWVLTAVSTVGVPLSLWWTTTERLTAAVADRLRGVATPGDLILISSSLKQGGADPAGLMRPFGALATVVVDPQGLLPDLSTFPQERVFLVGELDKKQLGLSHWQRLSTDVVLGVVQRPGRAVVGLMDRLMVSVEKDGQTRPCNPPHVSGGVRCGGQPWQHVGPAVIRANNRLVACLWAHPFHQHVMHMDFAPQGSSTARLWLQYTDDVIRDAPRPEVRLVASSGGKTLSQVMCTNHHQDGATGLRGHCPLEVELPQQVAAGQPWLRLSISTSDAARQLLCLGGELIPHP